MQRFRDGDADEADARTLHEVLEPHIVERSEGFALLRLADGAADVYGVDDLAPALMINHASGSAVWDRMFELACRADLAIMPVSRSTVVTKKQTLRDLPPDLADEAVSYVRGGTATPRRDHLTADREPGGRWSRRC